MEEAKHKTKSRSWLDRLNSAFRWPQIALRRNNAFNAGDRFMETRSIGDLNEAIRVARENVEYLPFHHDFLTDLGYFLADRYELLAASKDFEEARGLLGRVLQDKRPDKAIKVQCAAKLSHLYCIGAQKTGTPAFAEEALRLARLAVDECSQLSRIEAAVDAMQEAINTAEEKTPQLIHVLLGYLYDYYEKTEEMQVLEYILQSTRTAADLAPIDSSLQIGRLFEIAEYLHEMQKGKTREADALEEATEAHEGAAKKARGLLASTPVESAAYVAMLMQFGRSLYRWYMRTQSVDDLVEAIRCVRRAIDITPLDSPKKPHQLMVYARYISHWSDELGPTSELKEGIGVVRQILDIAPDDFLEENRPICRFIHYLHVYYHLTRELEYLEQSISLSRRAIDMMPRDNPNLTNVLFELVFSLSSRYENTRALADLKELVKMAKYMVDTTPDDHRDRSDRVGIYIGQLITLCNREPNRANITEALKTAELAVRADLGRGVNPTKAYIVLAHALEASYEFSGKRYELEKSAVAVREGVRHATRDFDKLRALSLLSSILFKQYRLSKTLESLNEAIDAVRKALELTPTNQYYKYFDVTKLANYLLQRGKHTGAGEDVKEAIKLLLPSHADNRRHYFSEIIGSTRYLADAYSLQNDWEGAFNVSSKMIETLPTMIPNSLENSDKQWVVQFMTGMSCLAASAALKLGKPPFVVLDALERGRGMLGTSIEDMRRTDITDLQAANLELAKEFARLKNQLEMPFSQSLTDANIEDNSCDTEESRKFGTNAVFDSRYQAGVELSQVVEEISNLPGFESFYSPPSEEDVRKAAIYGPLVVIIEGLGEYNAIIVEANQIQTLPLPNLSYKEVLKKVHEGHMGRPSILEWLWDNAMGPILSALGFSSPVDDGDNWPHVWWIPTGYLCKFPLHAAGYHTEGSGKTVVDRVISSYSSSVKSIIYGRRRQAPSSSASPGKAVLVAMEKTPRHARLPYATKEVRVLNEICKTMNLNVENPTRTKTVLLEHLKECTVFHFAGHGYTNQDNPSQSYLCLEKGPEDVIRVSDLLELDLFSRLPFLAYLSACGTGQTKADTFLDESIHLISSCQLAGFRHVIGTLWEVNDEICVDVATIVYEGIRDANMSNDSVARGLHQASMVLRDRWAMKMGHEMNSRRDVYEVEGEDETIAPLWVPYVHFGI
ncbi:unnamed protein product [Clonostachys solani]|uniref:CHAT domain-containing protein n=1 Tax=Clonostachys solani TaxID=160281 RepID=A0A9N9ZMB2_9HYPO|nr:unnamed protein product [Clonostachys solani]